MTAAKTYTHEEILPVIRGVALCILLAALDQTIIVPAVPRMARDLGGGSHIAWIISAYLLTGTAATPIFGRLSDIYGRRRLMQPAIIVFAAASLGCAAATHFWEIALWRAVQGIGGAGLMVIAQTAIADVAPPRERGRYQIYMSGMWGIASIAGPMLGGALTDSLSWRGIFWVNLPLCALAWVFSGRALRRLPPHAGAGQRIDFLGAALLVCAITAWLVLAASGGRDFPWDSRATLILVASGVVFTWLTAWVEHLAPAPMLPLRLFRNATVLGGLLLSATNSLCTFGGSLLLPLFFQYIKHTNAAASGLYTTPFLLAFVFLSYMGGQNLPQPGPHQAHHAGGPCAVRAGSRSVGDHAGINAAVAVRGIQRAARRRHRPGATQHHGGHPECGAARRCRCRHRLHAALSRHRRRIRRHAGGGHAAGARFWRGVWRLRAGGAAGGGHRRGDARRAAPRLAGHCPP